MLLREHLSGWRDERRINSPNVVNGMVYYGDFSGDLYAFNLSKV